MGSDSSDPTNLGPNRGVPFYWWGPVWHNANPISLTEVVRSGSCDPDSAAVLTLLIEQGVSVTIASQRARVGKSTLLAALTAAIDPSRTIQFLRGSYESVPIGLLTSAAAPVLLINEISPHLPVYTWGSVLHSALQCASQGGQLLSTTHGLDSSDVLQNLTSYPLRLPMALAASLRTIVILEEKEHGTPGKVTSITILLPGAHPRAVEWNPVMHRQSGGDVILDMQTLNRCCEVMGITTDDLSGSIASRAAEIASGNQLWMSSPLLFRTANDANKIANSSTLGC